MPPFQNNKAIDVLEDHQTDEDHNISTAKNVSSPSSDFGPTYSFKFRDIKWRNAALIVVVHVFAFYGLWRYLTGEIKWQSAFVAYGFTVIAGLGVTAGAHRLWSHRAYKAKWPLRLFLALCNACALEMDIYDWCRDHRVHHKYSETNADPHNSNRGFFFAHMGWLMLYKHPEVIKAGAKLDFSDLWADPIVRWQRRFYVPLVALFWFAIPTYLPVWLWGESVWNSFLFCVLFRYIFTLHSTWNVNSLAHLFGNQPYNVNIQPRENKVVTYLALGEGYHNYHHTFPWDYSASEFGFRRNFNFTTFFIDCCEKLGLAYELKKPSEQMIQTRIQREGGMDEELKSRRPGFGFPVVFDWALGIISNASILLIPLGLRAMIAGL